MARVAKAHRAGPWLATLIIGGTLASLAALAQPADGVTWWFDRGARAGDVVTLLVSGLPDLPGVWIAVVSVDAPIGSYADWTYPPARAEAIRLRLPDRSQWLEFRLYRDGAGRTELLARSAAFVPEPPEATLRAPGAVAAATPFEVYWHGPNRSGDVVVLVDPSSAAAAIDVVALHLGNPLTLEAPWEPGAYQLRYLTGADRVALASLDIVVVEQTAAPAVDGCVQNPDEASLLSAFDGEVVALAAMARSIYGLEDVSYHASARLTGSTGVVDATYVLQLTDPAAGASVTVEGSLYARFTWSGCTWILLDVTY